jgi:hypothetical protein
MANGRRPSAIDHRRGSPLQFEVNGQLYFLNFEPSEGRWFVYESTKDGILTMAVHDDAPPLVMPSTLMLDPLEKEKVN